MCCSTCGKTTSSRSVSLFLTKRLLLPAVEGRGGRGRGGERPAPVYTVEGGRRLAENPLSDFVFLSLEGRYDGDAVRAIAGGLRSPTAVSRKSLLVRIPSLENAGEEATKERIKEILVAGADGVTLPHVRNLEEARQIAGFFQGT